MIDEIVMTKNGNTESIARIEYRESDEYPFSYRGNLLSDKFSARLKELINEYHELVAGAALTLLDDVEQEIYSFNLHLKEAGFMLHAITFKGDEVSFFSKYPSGQGFMDHHPWTK